MTNLEQAGMDEIHPGEKEKANMANHNDATDNETNINEQDLSGFANVYMIELLYKEKPQLSKQALYEKMQQYTGEVQLPEEKVTPANSEDSLAVWETNKDKPDESESGVILFFHMNHMVPFQEGPLPAQTCIMTSERAPQVESYESALQQAWHWTEAREAVADCSHSLLLTDFCARGLDYKERLQLITGALRALLETAPCEAVYFRASDKIVQPQVYLEAIDAGQRLYGAMNVRFYNVEGRDSGRDEMLIDTCGLAALGVSDVQCHFYDMEPNEVASLVGDIAYYIFEQGDVIRDGETVGSEELRWLCEHQHALAAPPRYVLDLNPGPEHYAGIQHHGQEGGTE